MDSININIAGDLFLGRRIESIAINNPESLFDEKIYGLFNNSDLNIVNLESSLTHAGSEHQITKTGPHLKSTPQTIGVLDFLKVGLVTLANNHIYDYGDKGLSDTLDLCRDHKISTVGAGLTMEEASEIYYKKFEQLTVGIVNIAENEWSNANGSHGGANPLNIIANLRSIQRAKKEADIVILVIHGGIEYFKYPSPRIVDLYRFYAEQGATIIIGHHSHSISGYEIFKGVPIFYGLGNFLFDSTTDFEGWYEGVLLNIQINKRIEVSWSLIPYKQCKGQLKVELFDENNRLEFDNSIKDINEIIADPELLQREFDTFIDTQKKYVLSNFSTSYVLKYNFLRSVIRKLKLEQYFIRRNQLKAILNFSRCESLQDVSLAIIENYIKTK